MKRRPLLNHTIISDHIMSKMGPFPKGQKCKDMTAAERDSMAKTMTGGVFIKHFAITLGRLKIVRHE